MAEEDQISDADGSGKKDEDDSPGEDVGQSPLYRREMNSCF